MFHRSVNSKTIMTFNHHHRTRVSTMTIAAVALLFAADPVLGNQKVLAANLCGSGLGCGDNPDYGISYPSHSHTFSGWGGTFFTSITSTAASASITLVTLATLVSIITSTYATHWNK